MNVVAVEIARGGRGPGVGRIVSAPTKWTGDDVEGLLGHDFLGQFKVSSTTGGEVNWPRGRPPRPVWYDDAPGHGLQSHAESAENAFPDEGQPAAASPRCSPWWEQIGHLSAPLRQAAADRARCGSSTTGRPTPTGTSTWARAEQDPEGLRRQVALRCSATTLCTCPAGTATGCRSSTRSTRSSGWTPASEWTCAWRWTRWRRSGAVASRLGFVDVRREEFKRLGVFGDWDDRYVTLATLRTRRSSSASSVASSAGRRLQGTQAGPLVHALQDRARPGRGGVRG